MVVNMLSWLNDADLFPASPRLRSFTDSLLLSVRESYHGHEVRVLLQGLDGECPLKRQKKATDHMWVAQKRENNQEDVVISKSRMSCYKLFVRIIRVGIDVVAYWLPVYASCLRMIHWNCCIVGRWQCCFFKGKIKNWITLLLMCDTYDCPWPATAITTYTKETKKSQTTIIPENQGHH